jgi:hypothetical protein
LCSDPGRSTCRGSAIQPRPSSRVAGNLRGWWRALVLAPAFLSAPTSAGPPVGTRRGRSKGSRGFGSTIPFPVSRSPPCPRGRLGFSELRWGRAPDPAFLSDQVLAGRPVEATAAWAIDPGPFAANLGRSSWGGRDFGRRGGALRAHPRAGRRSCWRRRIVGSNGRRRYHSLYIECAGLSARALRLCPFFYQNRLRGYKGANGNTHWNSVGYKGSVGRPQGGPASETLSVYPLALSHYNI